MYNDKIEFLRRKINRTYKWYTGERTDGEATLNDVVGFFGFQFPEDRLKDFEITNLDVKSFSIEIRDNKYNHIYKARYSSGSGLLNTSGGNDYMFVNSTITYLDGVTRKSTKFIGDLNSIVEQLTLEEGSNEITVRLENPHRVGFSTDLKGITIALSSITIDENNYRQEEGRFYKILSKNEQYTFSQNAIYSKHPYPYDKYQYSLKDNIIYVVADNILDANRREITGFMIENNNIEPTLLRRRYLPSEYIYREELDEELKNKTGFIKLNGRINRQDKDRYYVTISKEKGCITIDFRILCWNKEEHQYDTIVLELNSFIRPDLEGPISTSDIEIMINVLRDRYGNFEFINMVIDELSEFGNRINARNGVVERELSLSDPSQYIDMPFDDITKIFINGRKEIFEELINEAESIQNKSKDNVLEKKDK